MVSRKEAWDDAEVHIDKKTPQIWCCFLHSTGPHDAPVPRAGAFTRVDRSLHGRTVTEILQHKSGAAVPKNGLSGKAFEFPCLNVMRIYVNQYNKS